LRNRQSVCVLALCLLAGAIGTAARAASLQPYLVKDINQLLVPADSDPADFHSLGPVVLFTADDGSTGRELWRSDGTTGGTFRLTDACAGECSSAPLPLAVGGSLYFFAPYTLEFAARELWVSDGTAANTRSLTPPMASIRAGLWLPIARKLLFFANDGVHGEQPWISDGTAGGTFALADQGPTGVDVRVAFGSGALFSSYLGSSLWFTDGTIAGTRKVRSWQGSSCIHNVGVVDTSASKPRAVFLACTAKGMGLWTTDGTTAGTKSLMEIQRPSGPSQNVFLVVGSRYFFTATKSTKQGEELWVSDGSAKGTKSLTSLKPEHALAPYLTSFGALLVFFPNDGTHGRELWTSDGSAKGTRLVADVCPGSCDGAAYPVGTLGNLLYFIGNDGNSGWELWATDGKAAATRRVVDLCGGACSSNPFDGTTVGNRLVFEATVGTHAGLWSTDGGAAGTVELGPFAGLRHPHSTILAKAPLGNRLAFAARTEADGMELWITDGTPAGTTEVADIAPATPGSGGAGLIGAAGAKMVFLAGDGLHDTSGLWCSDGSEAGTTLVRWLEPGEGDVPPLAHVTLADTLVYEWRDAHGTRGLWRTDCSDGGTLRLTPEGIVPVIEGSNALAAAGGKVFFFARNEAFETTLWVSDGTAAGTHAVVDLPAMGVRVEVGGFELVAYGPKVYFCANENASGDELWSSDGTAAGTGLAVDLVPGFESVRPHGFAVGPHGFFFSAFGITSSSSLWFSDGTPAGTVLLSENLGGLVVPTADGAIVFAGDGIWKTAGTAASTTRFLDRTNWRVDEAVAQGNRVVFTGPSCDAPSCYPDTDPVLFETDGTAASTQRLHDPDGNFVVAPRSLVAFAGEVVFFARRGADAFLWQTDAGIARPLQRILPDYQVNDPIATAGNRLFFKGNDATHGQELWAVRPQ